MNENSIQTLVRNAFYRCIRVMNRKSREYSPNEDRLENFKESGQEDNISPEEALWGMLRKHLTSLGMMCREVTAGDDPLIRPPSPRPQEQWEEKLTDAHNYLFLLEALVKERYGWVGPEAEINKCRNVHYSGSGSIVAVCALPEEHPGLHESADKRERWG